MKYKWVRFDGEDAKDTYAIAAHIDYSLNLPPRMNKIDIDQLKDDVNRDLSRYWMGAVLDRDEYEEVRDANEVMVQNLMRSDTEVFDVALGATMELEKHGD